MAVKIIYFTVGGKPEQAEFRRDDRTDDIREIFRAAAEAGPHDVLKLYNTRGNIVSISSSLADNDPTTRYKLEVVASHCAGASIAAQLGFDIRAVESRLENLEKKVLVENGATSSVVSDMKNKVDTFKKKLESVEHLSWLGLFKDISSDHVTLQPFWNRHSHNQKMIEQDRRVYETFTRMGSIQLADEMREYLRKTTFDNWQWDEPEMLILLRQMYIDLGLIVKFNIELHVLDKFLYEVYKHYNPVPFHNFKHCFMVTQMMYGLIWLCGLNRTLDDIDILILLTSAICHDLDHPGYNNAYQINARTELAMRYNDISPLENHHCAIAFELLQAPETAIFNSLSDETYRTIREGIIKCILSTDMAKHSEILSSFKNITSEFDFESKEDKSLLMMILLKVADVSNEVRPMEVAEPWLECLLQEFFNQSDVEKLEGLPVAPFMDREKVSKPSAQIGFINFVLLPLFQTLANLFPSIQDDILKPVQAALAYYTDMQKANEETSLSRRASVESFKSERRRSSNNSLNTTTANTANSS